ncbi:hypothetical protein L195_g054955 [Trifolium pratense]|uniref:Uncharacterized protein n=1 Tax=Trifolium pratense TaxID=57577 RepID=A0A2K3KIV6_TRIPR|nr:hypothetical protein L195_g049535 [Trifolium pratense]PNX66193.1 hypothetical protein L195_g054955 [Trifolium pratense]
MGRWRHKEDTTMASCGGCENSGERHCNEHRGKMSAIFSRTERDVIPAERD